MADSKLLLKRAEYQETLAHYCPMKEPNCDDEKDDVDEQNNNRNADSLPLVSIVASKLCFVKFVGAELDGGVGHDPDHGGRVPPPQAEQAFLHVRAAEEPEGLLRRKPANIIVSGFCPLFLY